MIRLFQPTLGREELDAIAAVFEDHWPGPGPRVRRFERAFAAYLGVEPEETIAVTSCTEGLFQAVDALRLGPTDEVVLPTVSFIGAAHAVRATGARVRLADVDPVSLNPTLEHLEAVLGKDTKAILLLHFGGRLEAIRSISDMARAHGITLIEDAACALGGTNEGIPYGTLGDVGVWSFDAMKLLVTGDGGMMRISDPTIRRRICDRVRLGGVRPGLEGAAARRDRWWELDPGSWGRKAFMNDLTAAIGLVQLGKVDRFLERRRAIAAYYDANLSDVSWLRLRPRLTSEDAPYFYWIQTRDEKRDELAYHLRANDIYTTFRYWPLHRTGLYEGEPAAFPGGEKACRGTLLLPLHQNLSDSEVEHVVSTIKGFST